MSSHYGTTSGHHSDRFICPKCGGRGALHWDDVSAADGARKELAAIVGNFYERLEKRPPHGIELVCKGCGTVQKYPSLKSPDDPVPHFGSK